MAYSYMTAHDGQPEDEPGSRDVSCFKETETCSAAGLRHGCVPQEDGSCCRTRSCKQDEIAFRSLEHPEKAAAMLTACGAAVYARRVQTPTEISRMELSEATSDYGQTG